MKMSMERLRVIRNAGSSFDDGIIVHGEDFNDLPNGRVDALTWGELRQLLTAAERLEAIGREDR